MNAIEASTATAREERSPAAATLPALLTVSKAAAWLDIGRARGALAGAGHSPRTTTVGRTEMTMIKRECERQPKGRTMNIDLLVAGPYVGLGVTLRSAAHQQYAFGKWPRLVADTWPQTFQIDLDVDLTNDQARAVLHDRAGAVAEWKATVAVLGGVS